MDRLMSAAEVAEILGVKTRSVHAYGATYKIGTIIGGARLYTQKDVDFLLSRKRCRNYGGKA